jgi:hypothetical protein
MITFADTPADFVSAIQHAMQNDSPRAAKQRNQYTESLTWSASLEEISDLIEPILHRGKSSS